MTILFETHEVKLKAGDLYVVPKGILHKPIAEEVCKVLMIEPAGTINTGDVENQLTIENPDWL